MFIRINSDGKNFSIFKEINKINRHIKKSTETSTKKTLINDLSKRLLDLEYNSKHSIKSKCLKWILKNNTANNIRHEEHTIKNKTDKDWEKIETAYCLGCKDYTGNFKPQVIKIMN